MDSLDGLVTQTQGLSGRKDDLVHLQGLLQSKGGDILARSSHADLERVLAVLDPAAHSLTWLWVLDALTAQLMRSIPSPPSGSSPRPSSLSANGSAAAEQVVTSVSSFLALCSKAQVRLDPPKFAGVCRRLKECLIALGAERHAIRGLLPLKSAISKLAPSPSHLTPVHADFLQLCLLARQQKQGHQILCNKPAGGRRGGHVGAGEESEELIFEIDPHETAVTQTDFLLFCYYGGMVCLGMRRLEQASRMFFHALTAPAVQLSAITVACFKKYLLVSLITQGKVPTLPRFTPSVVQRQLKPLCGEYSEMAEAYGHKDRDPRTLSLVLEKHKTALLRDGNWGLAKQVLASLTKRNIQRLTQTYLTLSLQDIASTVHLNSADEAETHILNMIQSGEIHARISQKDGMVSFLEDPHRYDTHSTALHLHQNISRVFELGKRLEEMDSSVACDRQYLHRMHMREKTGRFVDPEEIEFGGPSRMFDTM